MQPPRPTTRARGYTLVEVLIVVVIVGIISAIVVPQMLTAGELGVQSATRIIVADMMFAQNDAMAQQSPRKAVFVVTDNRYSLTESDGTVLSASWMSGKTNNYVIDFDEDSRFAGVEIVSADFGGDNEIVFDDLGAPDTGGTIELRYNDHRFRVTVAEFTGRITVERIG